MSDAQREAFEIFRENFSQLHEKLDSFVRDLPSKCRQPVPEEFQNVEVLPTIMAPSDSDFLVEESVTVLEKWKYLSDNLEIILSKMGLFVVYYPWYKEQQQLLERWILLVNKNAFTLGKATPNYGLVVEVNAGLGGVNWYSDDMERRMDMCRKTEKIRNLMEAIDAERNKSHTVFVPHQ